MYAETNPIIIRKMGRLVCRKEVVYSMPVSKRAAVLPYVVFVVLSLLELGFLE